MTLVEAPMREYCGAGRVTPRVCESGRGVRHCPVVCWENVSVTPPWTQPFSPGGALKCTSTRDKHDPSLPAHLMLSGLAAP